MKRISVFNLCEEMVTAESVYDLKHQLIMDKGTRLTKTMIRRLESLDVLAVYIEDSPLTAAIREYVDPDEAVDDDSLSYSQRVRASKEYQEFRKNYDLKIDSLKDCLNSVVEKNLNLDVNSLLQSSLDMISNNKGGNVGVLDMLHNMREYDDSTYAHSMNVALISNVLASWLKLSPAEIEMATACGLFHDIGKIAVDQQLIQKPGKLTASEYSVVQNHTIDGYKILKARNVDPHIMNSALMHHERNDGTGYPLKLQGSQIDKYASIVAIADVYDAMTATRVYRGPLCPFRVIEMFEEEGFQRYNAEFLIPFLENVVNTYLQNRCVLSDGREGTIIFVNRNKLSRPIVDVGGKYINLTDTPSLSIESLL